MKAVAIALAVALISASAAFAQEKQEPAESGQGKKPKPALSKESEEEFLKILKQLDSDEYKERAAAQEALKKLCGKERERIVPLLKRHHATASEEVKTSLERSLKFIDRLRRVEELLAVFDVLAMPDTRGKKLVLYNTGGYGFCGDDDKLRFHYAFGWVLSDSRKEIELFETSLAKSTRRRDYSLPREWYRFKDQHPKDMPLPGCCREYDFKKFCRSFLDGGPTSYWAAIEQYAGGRLSNAVEAALFAYWALQHGMDDTAMALVALTRVPLREDGKHRTDKELTDLIAGELATIIRWRAINRANEGVSRPELLKLWETVLKLPRHEFTNEAKQMAELYRKMIEEDGKWKELTKDEIGKLSAQKQAACWMHKLRDADARQICQPGDCMVVSDFCWRTEKPNPAVELRKLGWSVIPLLIEHLDDPRPTRCMAFQRSYSPGSFYLLRCGDCCQQIFESMTSEDIFTTRSSCSYPFKDGGEQEAKKKAREWWESHKDDDQGKYYFKLLESDSRYRQWVAIGMLLIVDRKKHLPKLLEVAAQDKTARARRILDEVEPYLGKEHKALLEGFLKSEDLDVVLISARTLWHKCRAESGPKEVIKRLRTLTREQEDKCRFCYSAMYFLVRVQEEFAVKALCELINHRLRCVKTQAVVQAYNFPSKEVLEALIPLLDDRDDTGSSEQGGDRYRYCDKAAYSICMMVGYSKKFDSSVPVADRDKFIEELKGWLAKNRDSLDWKSLRERAQERIEAQRSGR
jgi:hypothetical protein